MKYREAQDDVAVPTGPVPTVFEALVRMRCLTATYNRTAIVLAPHILYTRHDELYVDGIVLERDGAVPKESRLGTFKLIGLGDLALIDRAFRPDALFVRNDPKYAATTLMAVEAA